MKARGYIISFLLLSLNYSTVSFADDYRIEPYFFNSIDSNCNEQGEDCGFILTNRYRALVKDKRSSFPEYDSYCRNRESECLQSGRKRDGKGSYQLIVECADIKRSCWKQHKKQVKAFEKWRDQAKDYYDIEVEACKTEQNSCITAQQKRIAKKKQKQHEQEQENRSEVIVSLISQNNLPFQWYSPLLQTKLFGSISLDMSENEVMNALSVKDIGSVKLRGISQWDARTSKSLINDYNERSYTLYNNLYPLFGKNRQTGILYGSKGVAQININLSGERYRKILDDLQSKYRLNGEIKLNEFGINHSFAVFNNGQIILWENDAFKMRKQNESKEYFLYTIYPNIQLIFSNPNLGESVFHKLILEKAIGR